MRIRNIPTYILIIILALVTFTIYFNALQGDFLIDDQAGILNSPRLHDIKTYFAKYFSFRPGMLYEVMYVFIWHIGGGRPFCYHLFDVLVHIGCVILLFILCNLLFKNRALSFFSSLIFAVHPIHTEAVSWISGVQYIFSSFFFLAVMIFYLKSERSFFYLLLTVIFFVISFFAGPAVAVLPIMIIFYDIFFRKRSQDTVALTRFRWVMIFLIFLVSFMFIALNFVGRSKFTHLIFLFRGFSYLIVVTKAFAYYLKILYLPLARGLYHTFGYNTIDIQKISPVFFLAVAALLIAIISFFKYRRSFVPLSFGIMWFFITFAPYSNIIPMCNIVSERYMYLPSVGFSIIMAALFLKTWEVINRYALRLLRMVAIAAVTLFLASYALLTIKRNYDYNNIFSYWESNIRNFPDGYIFYNNLAGTFYAMGNIDQAIGYCWINLMINPNQPHVWCNLGKVYQEKKNLKQAKDCYQEALKIDKHCFPAYEALAGIEKELGKK